MTKLEFLNTLESRLSPLPKEERDKSLEYFSEQIEDRKEAGMTEEEAVASLESVDVIAQRILNETPVRKIVREKVRRRGGLTALEIVLLILGFPLWFPIVIIAIALLFVFFVLLWTVVIVIFAVAMSFAAAAVAMFIAAFPLFGPSFPAGLFSVGGALFCLGLCIVVFWLMILAAKGIAKVMAASLRGIRKIFL